MGLNPLPPFGQGLNSSSNLFQKHSLREGLNKNGGKCDLFRTKGGGGGPWSVVTLLR